MKKVQEKKTLVLCILDGWGISNNPKYDSIALSETPNIDKIMLECPYANLVTHGKDVGLPVGQVGNSEVGHINIGAGRIVSMALPRINLSIHDGSFAKSRQFKKFVEHLKDSDGVAHLMGLISPGGVHSHYEQIAKVANLIIKMGIDVNIHLVLDGRDVAPKSAVKYIECFIEMLDKKIRLATVCGRFYAMDRDNRWDRTELAYRNTIEGTGPRFVNIFDALVFHYNSGETDEFITPSVLSDYSGVSSNSDGLLFMNFRADRARQICSAFADPNFGKFSVSERPAISMVCGLVEYSSKHRDFMGAIFKNAVLKNTLGEWLSLQGRKQFRLAETEKYAHVTFFFNGGDEASRPGEMRCLVPSPKVRTYDLCPEMSASEVTKELLKAISSNQFDLIVVNYANPDMVGHTGNLEAAIQACESVDIELGKVLKIINPGLVEMLVIADHGNCETMFDIETGVPHTSHTLNPVPIILVGDNKKFKLHDGILADVAPTILDILNIEKPPEMTGKSLVSLKK